MQSNTETSINIYDSYNQPLNQQNLSNNTSISTISNLNYVNGYYDTYHNQYSYGCNSPANFPYYPSYQQFQGSSNHPMTR